MSDPGLGIFISISPDLMFQGRSSFMELYSSRTEKVINQGVLKPHCWKHQGPVGEHLSYSPQESPNGILSGTMKRTGFC